ncbi:MAG: glycosyltransferase family 39 protein [Nitrospirae bacterium]|nr:glycosyltransferase family 39 protein [Nitrospirota bacterium]
MALPNSARVSEPSLLSQSRKSFPGWLLVLLFGGTLGYFLWNTFPDPVPHLYNPSLQSADWIRPSDKTPQGYFRKEVFVDQAVREAWITVAATDDYQLYLNGESVGHETFISANASGVYDVSRRLASGKNVIAASIHRQSYPGPSRLALRLVLRDYSGRERVVVTDRSWRVSTLEERQNMGLFMWYAPDFNAAQWVFATDSGPVREGEIIPISFDPDSIGGAPRGRWIMHPDPGSRSSYFEKEVALPSRVREAWIRISASEHYVLLLNGFPVADQDSAEAQMDLYDIAPLLRAGSNRISIGSISHLGPPRLFADGRVHTRNGQTVSFGTDTTWTASRLGGSGTIPTGEKGLRPTEANRAVMAVTDLSLTVGAFKKSIRTLLLPTELTWRAYGRLLLSISLGMFAAWAAWVGFAWFLARRFQDDRAGTLRSVAFLYLPSLLGLGGLLLLRFDIRFDPSFPFQARFIARAVLLLLVFKTIFLIERGLRGQTAPASVARAGAWDRFEEFWSRRGSLLWTLLIFCLVFTGLGIRLHGLDEQSLTHDEASLVQYVQDMKQGEYPTKKIGSLDKPLSTYELIPYPVLLSVTILGWSDWAARLPAALIGGLTILLLYIAGRDLFNRWVGLLSAAIYAFSPWAIIWSQNLFYPQQTQFASLLTVYLFFKAIRHKTLVPRYLYLTGASFLFNYLSWEGSGFVLPALGVGIIAYKEDDFSWLKSGAMWRGMGGVALVIYIQYSLRILTQDPYLAVGTGPGDIKIDPLFFLNAMYDPYFYLQHFFWLEGHEILTVLFISGAFLVVRDRTLRYLYAILLSLCLAMTNFLPAYAQRYFYYAQPLLILSAAAVCVALLRGLYDARPADLIRNASRGFSRCSVSVRIFTVMLIPVLVFLSTNSTVLKLYRFSEKIGEPPPQTRLGVYYIDYRSANEYLERSFREGDAIVAVMTHMVYYYAGLKSDYNFNSTLASRSYYDPEIRPPQYLDRYMGNPVMRDFGEARDVLLGHPRVWIVAAPSDGFVSQNEKDLVQYLLNNSKVMYESYKAKVYLWKG